MLQHCTEVETEDQELWQGWRPTFGGF